MTAHSCLVAFIRSISLPQDEKNLRGNQILERSANYCSLFFKKGSTEKEYHLVKSYLLGSQVLPVPLELRNILEESFKCHPARRVKTDALLQRASSLGHQACSHVFNQCVTSPLQGLALISGPPKALRRTQQHSLRCFCDVPYII